MLARGVRSCLATSSGNTGSSLAAYCARYGIRCTVIVNENAPAGKLAQMQAHGARVIRVPGFATSPEVTTRVYSVLERFSEQTAAPLVVSAYRYCPQGMEGVESLGRELRSIRRPSSCVRSRWRWRIVLGRMPRIGGSRRTHACRPAGGLPDGCRILAQRSRTHHAGRKHDADQRACSPVRYRCFARAPTPAARRRERIRCTATTTFSKPNA